MAFLFFVLVLASIAGLIVGLIKPTRIKLKSRKQVALIFGGGIVLFFLLIGITAGQSQSPAVSAPISGSTASVQATSTPTTASTNTTVVSIPNTPEQNDALYISAFRVEVAPDIKDAGTDLQNAGNDLQKYDFKSAISDMQSVQSDLLDAQTQIKDIVPATMTADMNQINTLFNSAIASGLKGADIAITDLENADNAGVNTVAMPYFSAMETGILKASQLMAGWEAKNPQLMQSQ